MKKKDAAKNAATKKVAIKRIASAVLSLAVAFTFMPWGAFDSYAEEKTGPANSITAYMSVSNAGTLATAQDGSAMAFKAVTVSDKNQDGTITYDEALMAAHEQYCPAGSDGYSIGAGFVTKLWGIDNGGSCFFNINGTSISKGVDEQSITSGDYLTCCNMADMSSWTDVSNTYFENLSNLANTLKVKTNTDFTLTLKGVVVVDKATWAMAPVALSGISVGVWNNGDFNPLPEKTTDTNGEVTLSFDKAGTYIVTAEGRYDSAVIMAPTCIVTVTDPSTGGGGGGGAIAQEEKPEAWAVSTNGLEAKEIIETKEGYTYLDMNGNPQLATLYTVVLYKAADKAKLTFDRDTLVYNYNLKGDYLAGFYEDCTKGQKEYEVDIDSNGDFAADVIQVQNPYNEDWTGGEIRYAVTFKYATDEMQAQAIASKLSPSVKAKKVGKKVKVTATAPKLAKVKEQGFTVKYKFYRSKKKASGYVLVKTQKSNAYTFKKGIKNKKYYYKAKLCIYKDGKLLASTPLTKCKYVSKKWK